MSKDNPVYRASPGRPKRRRKRKVRKVCLKCDRVFLSMDGTYNRICPACNESNERLAPAAEGKQQDGMGDWIY